MVLTLYKIDGSPPVRSVHMTIAALGLQDIEYVDVNIMTGEHLKEDFLKMNPQHTVPLLKDDDFLFWDRAAVILTSRLTSEVEKLLFGSKVLLLDNGHAIAIYLITVYGNDDSLYPADPKKRAIINQRLHFDSGILFPALRGAVEPVFFFGETSLNPESFEKIRKGYEFAELFLTDDWMAGDEVTLADICCVSSISSMNEVLPIDREQFPNLASWLERCSKLDFYIKGNSPGLVGFSGLLDIKLGDRN